MTYSIRIYRHNEGLVYEVSDLPTRADLAETLNPLLLRFPREAGFEFNVTATVCKNYTLLDSDVLSGEQVSTKIWDVLQDNGEIRY